MRELLLENVEDIDLKKIIIDKTDGRLELALVRAGAYSMKDPGNAVFRIALDDPFELNKAEDLEQWLEVVRRTWGTRFVEVKIVMKPHVEALITALDEVLAGASLQHTLSVTRKVNGHVFVITRTARESFETRDHEELGGPAAVTTNKTTTETSTKVEMYR